jgi:hypothetical protein
MEGQMRDHQSTCAISDPSVDRSPVMTAQTEQTQTMATAPSRQAMIEDPTGPQQKDADQKQEQVEHSI